jgi:hypothetical protein
MDAQDLTHNLSRQDLGLQTMEHLRTVFSTVPPGTRILNLSFNKLYQKTDAQLAELLDLLPDSIEKINFGENNLGKASELTSLFAVFGSRRINFSFNDNLGNKTSEELVTMFAVLQPGVCVNLSRNDFRQKNGDEITDMFAAIPPGVSIDFASSSIFYGKNRQDLIAMFAAFKPRVEVRLCVDIFINPEIQTAMLAALQPGVRIHLMGHIFRNNTLAELRSMFAAIKPGVKINLRNTGIFNSLSLNELEIALSSLRSGVSIDLGLSEAPFRIGGYNGILSQIPEGVTLSLGAKDLLHHDARAFLLSAPQITSIELASEIFESTFKNLTLKQLVKGIMLLPISVQKLTIKNDEIFAHYSKATQERIKLLLKSRFREVTYLSTSEAESIFSDFREVFSEVIPAAPQIGSIVLDYLGPSSTGNWESRFKKEDEDSTSTLLSLLKDWVNANESDEGKHALVQAIHEFSSLAEFKLANNQSTNTVHYGMFLTLELLEGNINTHEYQGFIDGLIHPEYITLVEQMLKITFAFAAIVAFSATAMPIIVATEVAALAGMTYGLISYGFFSQYQNNKQQGTMYNLTQDICTLNDNLAITP